MVNCKCTGYIYGAVKLVTQILTHLTLSLNLTLFLMLMDNGVMTVNLRIDNVQQNRTLSINNVIISLIHKYSHFVSYTFIIFIAYSGTPDSTFLYCCWWMLKIMINVHETFCRSSEHCGQLTIIAGTWRLLAYTDFPWSKSISTQERFTWLFSHYSKIAHVVNLRFTKLSVVAVCDIWCFILCLQWFEDVYNSTHMSESSPS